MGNLSRRAMVGASAGSLAALCLSRFATTARAAAPPQCAPHGLAPFLPSHLTVDCASRRNIHAFQEYPDYLGLAAVVSMTIVRTKLGTLPASATLFVSGSPIPGVTLPPDEYFLRFVLQAPLTSFIGFEVDVAHSKL